MYQKFLVAGGFEGENKGKGIWNKLQFRFDGKSSIYVQEDTRIWLHTIKAKETKLLIFSPDTDIYHIGVHYMDSVLM